MAKVTAGRSILLVRESFSDPPALDTAVSHATLRRVGEGALPETLRLHRPGRIVAFGPQERIANGYGAAIQAATAGGFAAVERLAGGRAAVFHEGTLAFSWVVADPAPQERIRHRFETLSQIMAAAFRSLGVDARVGEVPGEYCPGEYSVNARGRTKLMGVGQRLTAWAAHVGGVVVVAGGELVRDILVPVYAAMGLEWNPDTAGSLADEVPNLSREDAEAAIIEQFASRFRLEAGSTSRETLTLARELLPRHVLEP
jgi:lipoate-protein ligase A